MTTKLLLLAISAAAACAPAVAIAPAPPPAPPVAAQPPALTNDIHWTRNSAEHRAAFLQAYRTAGERLRELEAGVPDGTWAVILDADETAIDNSTFQKRLIETGQTYSNEGWYAWAREEAALALPGAAEFTRLVRDLGGRVVFVTNRDEVICEPTRSNLRKVGIAWDLVLCRAEATGGSDKNVRFRLVQQGTAAQGVPPLRVLMWVGDNIQDFPDLTQEVRTRPDEAFAAFGRTYIVLPNPMYGSWERNPRQ